MRTGNISQRSFGALALAALLGAALLALVAGLALAPGSAGAATPVRAGAASCPGFKVLHDDRIGAASLPAGTYTVSPASSSGLTCKAASALFARFLADYDGSLPGGWRVTPEGSGRASFKRGAAAGFSVSRAGGEGGSNNLVGKLCPNQFTVNAGAQVGPLFFPRGQYLLYQPAGTGITCNRAAVLFTRFLSQPGGRLPAPWRLTNQTATFFKPENPRRSAFRVESLNGT